MSTYTSQQGFSVLPIILLAVIVSLIGLIGWRVFDVRKSLSSTNHQSQTEMQVKEAAAPINSKTDVEKEQTTLSNVPLDTDLNSSELDADLNDLL